jgi:hypothetical protein
MHPYQKEPGPYSRPPPPSLNGGLYTGEPFRKGAPWANVPATPDAGHLMTVAMQGLCDPPPPPGAELHIPGGGWRPGNNTPLLPPGSAQSRFPELNLTCPPPQKNMRQ